MAMVSFARNAFVCAMLLIPCAAFGEDATLDYRPQAPQYARPAGVIVAGTT